MHWIRNNRSKINNKLLSGHAPGYLGIILCYKL